MKARHIIYYIAAVFAVVLAASCSNIDPDDRLIYVKPADAKRAVLIEDFTGQKCPNCPRGSEKLNEIVQQYGDSNVIVVAIHSGPLGFKGTTKNVGLMTDEGDEYYKKWDKESKIGQPWVLFNRNQAPNNELDTWMSPVSSLIAKDIVLSIDVNNSYDKATRELTIDVDAFGTDGSRTAKLQVWLIEDGIVAMQTLGNGSVDRNYVHNHVFRTSVNGTWGKDVSIKKGEHTRKTYNYTLPEAWNVENVSVVAFVYDDTEVLQVTKKIALPITPTE